ncbi:MAG TPA: sensor domain-containing diguanylate cyclase [Thermoleophilia bacterium]|nr:sensor domain-containing diguanylate cyclase [Thermoleophilia bacterium]
MVEADKREQTSYLELEKSRLEESERQHVRTEKALERERDFLAAVLESADAFILVLDGAGRILQVNRAVELATGYSDDDLHGREFISALPIREAASALGDGLRRLGAGAGACPFENHWATSTGERLLVAGSLTPLREAGGALRHVIVTASDITQRRALEDGLRAMSLRDDMTGLYNRRGFALLAEQRLRDSRRAGSALTMIYADVDQLKSINDDFGHNAGDIALALCAGALEATFRESDIVARIGGDEFVALTEADARDLSTVTMRLEQELGRQTAASGLRFPVSLTIGSAHSKPPHALSLDDLLQQADEFMYERKHRTRPQSG